MANDMNDLYDEGTELDQESTVRDGADKAEKDSYESFLAPKSAFKGSLEPGTIHRVKVERTLDDEVMLRCVEGGKDESESEDNAAEESDEMYS